jgi:RNA polymerase sigma-70 factor (ECF subfamily)
MSELDDDDSKDRRNAFIKVFVAAQPKIFGYIVSLMSTLSDADEVLQETSIVMWTKFDDFALPTTFNEKTIDEFVAWGNQIAFYKVLNLRRKKGLSTTCFSDNTLQLISDEWAKQEQSRALEKRRQALKLCLDLLPVSQKEVLKQYYWHEVPVEQIASDSSRTTASVYKILQRVRNGLHQCINNRIAQQA